VSLSQRILAIAMMFAVSFALAGCSSWSRQYAPASTVVGKAYGGPVRATMRDGRMITLRDASVAGDSLFGRTGRSGDRVALAVNDIERLELPASRQSRGRPSAMKIGALVVLGLLVATLLLAGAVVGSAGVPR